MFLGQVLTECKLLRFSACALRESQEETQLLGAGVPRQPLYSAGNFSKGFGLLGFMSFIRKFWLFRAMASSLPFYLTNLCTIGAPSAAACIKSTLWIPSGKARQGDISRCLLSFVHDPLFEVTVWKNLASPPLAALAVRNVSPVCQQVVISGIC